MSDKTSHKVSQIKVRHPSLQYPLQSAVNIVPETRNMIPSHNHFMKAYLPVPCEVNELESTGFSQFYRSSIDVVSSFKPCLTRTMILIMDGSNVT